MDGLLPDGRKTVVVEAGGHSVKLTNLDKPFWPELGILKRHLLEYYARVARWLLPHVRDRPMVMKRYPDGAGGDFFFMKRAPATRPEWIEICTIGDIDYPMVQDLAALLWIVNLGCIDLNPWYARQDDPDRPDYLHFDLDPGGASFEQVRECALIVRDALQGLGMPTFVKTTGSKGVHVYVPIARGPTQREVWVLSKALALVLAERHPDLMTAEYAVAKRPAKRVLVDYNQNASGRTLASVYSVRPSPRAAVSTPVTWRELERGAKIDDFRLENVPVRLAKRGDLWAGVASPEGRFDLARLKAALGRGK